jgi:hypothetical protein
MGVVVMAHLHENAYLRTLWRPDAIAHRTHLLEIRAWLFCRKVRILSRIQPAIHIGQSIKPSRTPETLAPLHFPPTSTPLHHAAAAAAPPRSSRRRSTPAQPPPRQIPASHHDAGVPKLARSRRSTSPDPGDDHGHVDGRRPRGSPRRPAFHGSTDLSDDEPGPASTSHGRDLAGISPDLAGISPDLAGISPDLCSFLRSRSLLFSDLCNRI